MEFIGTLYRALDEMYLPVVRVVSHVVTSEYIHQYINRVLRFFWDYRDLLLNFRLID